MHRYFVSYAHSHGFGNCWLTLTRQIHDNADTTVLGETISADFGVIDPVILFFQLIETTKEA